MARVMKMTKRRLALLFALAVCAAWPVGAEGSHVHPGVLEVLIVTLTAPWPADVCVKVVGRDPVYVVADIEAKRDVSAASARRAALANVEALRRKLVSIAGATQGTSPRWPVSVGVASPSRWYGDAIYDRGRDKAVWIPCPRDCGEQGTVYGAFAAKKCRPPEAGEHSRSKRVGG